jgi:ABC-type Mn2+/Zn2+ transport system permease subunit
MFAALTDIGLLFVGMLALGVVIREPGADLHRRPHRLSFRDVLGVRSDEIRLGIVALVITVIGLVAGHRSFLALAVNRDKAETLGLRPGRAHAALPTLLALSVVSSFRVVGTLLVFGFLVAPPASVVLIVRRIPVAMAVAVLFGWSSVVLGLIVSYHHDTAASPLWPDQHSGTRTDTLTARPAWLVSL